MSTRSGEYLARGFYIWLWQILFSIAMTVVGVAIIWFVFFAGGVSLYTTIILIILWIVSLVLGWFTLGWSATKVVRRRGG